MATKKTKVNSCISVETIFRRLLRESERNIRVIITQNEASERSVFSAMEKEIRASVIASDKLMEEMSFEVICFDGTMVNCQYQELPFHKIMKFAEPLLLEAIAVRVTIMRKGVALGWIFINGLATKNKNLHEKNCFKDLADRMATLVGDKTPRNFKLTVVDQDASNKYFKEATEKLLNAGILSPNNFFANMTVSYTAKEKRRMISAFHLTNVKGDEIMPQMKVFSNNIHTIGIQTLSKKGNLQEWVIAR